MLNSKLDIKKFSLGTNVYDRTILSTYYSNSSISAYGPFNANTLIPDGVSYYWQISNTRSDIPYVLSSLDLDLIGWANNIYLQTITSNIISGYTGFQLLSIPEISAYNRTFFNAVTTGGTITLSVSEDYTGNLISLQNVIGTIDYNTGYYYVSNGTGINNVSGCSLVGTFNTYEGTYVAGTVIHPSSPVSAFTLSARSTNPLDMYEFHPIALTSTIESSAYEYFPEYPVTGIVIDTVRFDNFPEKRSFGLEVRNDYGGIRTALPPWYTYYWNLIYPTSGTVTTSYYSDAFTASSAQLSGFLQTQTFNSSTRQAYLSTFSFYVTAISGSDIAGEDNTSIVIDEFPDWDSFGLYLSISNNAPSAVYQNLWRLTNMNTVSAYTRLNIPGRDTALGSIELYWGDGAITPLSSVVMNTLHTYAVIPLSTFTIEASAGYISASNWLYPHNKHFEQVMHVNFVDRYLSGIFIVYPEYYFDINGNYILLDSSNYTNSPGACAYGEGSNVVINLSAWEPTTNGKLYEWSIGSTVSSYYIDLIPTTVGQREDQYTFGDTYTYSQMGSAIGLSVFDNTFPPNMKHSYRDDNNVLRTYPNYSEFPYSRTDENNNSNKLFQNVRVHRYESFTASVTNLIETTTSAGIILEATLLETFPSYSPVVVDNRNYVWVLSATGWTGALNVSDTDTQLLHVIVEGNGITPGTLKNNSNVTLSIFASGVGNKLIDQRDFESSPQSFITNMLSINFNVVFAPALKIFTDKLHALTGELVEFQNITDGNSVISGYIWDTGDGSGTQWRDVNDTTLVSAVYLEPGRYTISLSAITTSDVVLKNTFSNIITIETNYPEYDPDIIRTHSSRIIDLPYQLDDIRIKPNEWVVADNINSVFDKLNQNLEYIQNAAHKYIEPPTKYYGWLGKSKYNETDISWHVIIPGINGQVNLLENMTTNNRGLNTIKDVVTYNDCLYVVTDTEIQILSSDYNATEIDRRDIKTIGDPFGKLEAIEVNSLGQIFVLDTLYDRVIAFDNYENNGWKFLFTWGKYGGVDSYRGFKDPTDLHIDKNDNIWVTDRGNNVVKKYTKTGSWLATISNSNFSNIISTTTDYSGNIHVLSSSGLIVKLNKGGNFISKYSISNSNVLKKIISSQDGFLYVTTNKSIVKLTHNGSYSGSFGDTFSNVSYNGIYHDEHRNLFVTTETGILKFYEKNSILSVLQESTVPLWSMDDIYIDKNEYVQDWVYNRSFSRMYDNIDIIRRNIIGSIYESLDNQYKSKDMVVGLTSSRYRELFNTKDKNEIFIGLNEIVIADTINRCIVELLLIESLMLRIISIPINITGEEADDETDDIVVPDDDDVVSGFGWRWLDVSSRGMNPLTWKQASSSGFYATPWKYAKTGVERP